MLLQFKVQFFRQPRLMAVYTRNAAFSGEITAVYIFESSRNHAPVPELSMQPQTQNAAEARFN